MEAKKLEIAELADKNSSLQDQISTPPTPTIPETTSTDDLQSEIALLKRLNSAQTTQIADQETQIAALTAQDPNLKKNLKKIASLEETAQHLKKLLKRKQTAYQQLSQSYEK